MGSKLTKVYTDPWHGDSGKDDPNRLRKDQFNLVREKQGPPEGPYTISSYVAGMRPVNKEVERIARAVAAASTAALAAHQRHPVQPRRSANPRIQVRQGSRTDWHVLLVVGPPGNPAPGDPESAEDEDALSAALAIEYGSRSFKDSRGIQQPAHSGLGVLRAGRLSVGAI
jgi:hypothetical protein